MPDPSPLLTYNFSELYLFATFFAGMFMTNWIKRLANDE